MLSLLSLQVVCRLLSLPEDYWRRILIGQIPPSSSTSKMGQSEGQGEKPEASLTIAVNRPTASAAFVFFHSITGPLNTKKEALNLVFVF